MTDSALTPTIIFFSTADTDLLTAQATDAPWRVHNPARTDPGTVAEVAQGAAVAVVRLLGGRQAWSEGLDAVLALGIPTVVVGGESVPDAQLQAESTVPSGVVTQALEYLVQGGVDNLRNLHAFLGDTLLMTGEPFDPPVAMPECGQRAFRPRTEPKPDGPVVGVVYYRAHELCGNTAFVDDLCHAVVSAGGRPLPVFTGSLRGLRTDDRTGLVDLLRQCDVLITTVLAGGGLIASDAVAGGDEGSWDVGVLRDLNIPVIQGMALIVDRETWMASDAALSPLDATTHVMMPEFDGRIIGVPFSFKQNQSDGLPVYVADPERCQRLAGLAIAHGRLSAVPVANRKVAIVLTAYPTKHARVGNAVGLDTPASAVHLLHHLRESGYDLGGFDPSTLGRADDHSDGPLLPGDDLIHRLIEAGGHDVDYLTEDQLAAAMAKVPASTYDQWLAKVCPDFVETVVEQWGPAPGELYLDHSTAEPAITVTGLRFGNVVLMIQPPRGFGDNPIAIYHDPDMPPSHHYVAAYRWLENAPEAGGFGADAVIHLGKHGTLEWLPGKGLGMDSQSGPDAVLGNLPMIYPFIVNDPGEGAQAKRRVHATIIDHLVPPMARAETYGELVKLEQLLDEYAHVADLDPAKVPAVQQQIWDLVRATDLHRDLHTDTAPEDDDAFDEFVMHIDGYLCEIKDVQIRDGLHVLGQEPTGHAQSNLVLAILRASQMWGGEKVLPGLRTALAARHGLAQVMDSHDAGARIDVSHHSAVQNLLTEVIAAEPTFTTSRVTSVADLTDVLETQARGLVEALERVGWDASKVEAVLRDHLKPAPEEGHSPARVQANQQVSDLLTLACTEVVPRLNQTPQELSNITAALSGGYIPAGPSGSPTRGLINVLPTGRNFYTVDPRAVPSRNAWQTGVALAESLLARHRADTGEWPSSVGINVWGTAAMRTQGDDVAEVLHLLGVRPVWNDQSRRVSGFEVVSAEELGRPRVDVVVRISGFFRDAFPHVVSLMDDAVRAVAEVDEPAEFNPIRAHVQRDLAEHGDARRATMRIFGSAPGAYGAGLLQAIDSGHWRDSADLAEVYAVWGGYAYGRDLAGVPARSDMENTFARIQVAVKNQDTREHDIVDSDDYYQYHGGMVAMVRSLTGQEPAAYVGDSAVPELVRTRTLQEETRRVFRSRVVNPRWIAAMQRHGYKGAFEMAATVDYLFGFDATAGVVDDWMYESIAKEYIANPEIAEFMQRSNPWARLQISERLLDAAQRGLWQEPDQGTLHMLQEVVLHSEGLIEEQQ